MSSRFIRILNRVMLLLTVLLGAHLIVVGIDGMPPLAINSFTLGFGVIVIAGLMMMILGPELLDSPAVVMIATIIPLSLSLGLISLIWPRFALPYLVFATLGFLFVAASRCMDNQKLALISVIIVHGLAGLLLVGLPIVAILSAGQPWSLGFISLGGALIGIGGLLLAFLRQGNPLLGQPQMLAVFPGIYLLMTVFFLLGIQS